MRGKRGEGERLQDAVGRRHLALAHRAFLHIYFLLDLQKKKNSKIYFFWITTSVNFQVARTHTKLIFVPRVFFVTIFHLRTKKKK